MPLAPGDKLGPYEILSPIGKGGMGEVFKAHDSRLGRDVAIKVSATQFSERFEREARAIAALNHTNICTLFDVGPNYLVMEYVEGQSLQASIQAGPIPLETALLYARQVASALEAAHEKAITHRDLKPGNIMIKPDGSVKVLDFGLAKFGGSAPTAISEDSPTLSMAATQAGTILGTAAYMAPEQARGKPVDKRADIWAFGVVMHEMLTGQRTFKGEDLTETMAAVVMKDPDLAPIPRQVRRLLKKCLEKDPNKRLRDIADAWELLDPEPVEIQAVVASTPASKTPWAIAGAAVFALAGLAAWTFYPRPKPAQPEAIRFTLAPPPGVSLTGNRSGGSQVAVSPDGRYVAFVADPTDAGGASRTLWVRALGSLSAQKLDKTEGATDPFWSPDSKNIAFFADGKLRRISVSGGSPINICDSDADEGGSWFQPEGQGDGVVLFALVNGTPIQRVPATGGVPTSATKLEEGETKHTYPQFLPDGKRFLYHVTGPKPGIYVQTLGSDQRTLLLETSKRASFAPPDLLLFMRDSTLLAQHVEWSTLKLLGEPISVTDEVRNGAAANTRNAFSVSSTGVLAYRAGSSNQVQYRWYMRDGKPDGPALAVGANNGAIELSPDNKRAVFERASGNNTDLWLMEFPSGVVSRLTSDAGNEQDPVWSPDSRRIAFVKSDATGGKRAIYQMLIGSGKDSLVYPEVSTLKTWTREGLVGRLSSSEFLIPAPEENATKPITEKPRILIEHKYQIDQAQVSPDGKWVAYRSRESGTDEVWVATFPGFTDRRNVSGGTGSQPLWRADGKELIFLGPNSVLMSVDVRTGTTFNATEPRVLFSPPGNMIFSTSGHMYAMSSDAKRFLLRESLNTSSTELEPLYLILNWPSLLGK
ncbi:MAG: protein kinase [Acidobacteriota bacterium]